MLPFPMRSAPILVRYPQRRSDLQMRPLHPECIYGTFRRSDIASSFLPITSLQPLHFHAIAHSFALNGNFFFRQPLFPSNLSSVALCLCGKACVFADLPPLYRLFALFSTLVPFLFNRLQPLFPKCRGWGIPDASTGHPGWGYPLGVSTPHRSHRAIHYDSRRRADGYLKEPS